MVGNSIAFHRKRRGMSQTQLAERIGTTLNMLGKLERGDRTLDTNWLEKIGRALAIEPRDLIGLPPSEGRAVLKNAAYEVAAEQAETRSIGSGEVVEIARLDLSLPMGPGATVDDFIESEPLKFDLGYVRSFTRTPPHRLRLAGGAGDSMFPTLVPNDLVWIDTTQNQLLHADRIYAASINGGAAIKRLRPIAGGRRMLVISDNKMVEPYEVDADEVVIWGRVIRFARDI
ncbi:S24 family peptidase [Sphingomonas sp. DG1-23]|uniref:XRE family transcriptional regulator n=1 Tax=Sphingomonas sp. DG1-23 TaxID=3068316 RepID=UPI00273D88AB|nr:S24 family peptidase [Sphingomonas sp. DG1-23]MDP5279925.1 S24 family peptidase [Sphingomonas sp. DG1-23]